MRAYLVLVLLVLIGVCEAKRKVSLRDLPQYNNDNCPSGCMNGTDAMNIHAELSACKLENSKIKSLVRSGGNARDIGGTAAQDILSGLLSDTEQMSRRKAKCHGCVKQFCQDPNVQRHITDSTEVLVFDGRRAHHCKGCMCAYREVAEHTREQHQRASHQRVSRSVVTSYATYAVIMDHGLYNTGDMQNILDGLPKAGTKALVRQLKPHERECFDRPAEEQQQMYIDDINNIVSEYHFGQGAFRTYIAELNEDKTLARLIIYVYRHE